MSLLKYLILLLSVFSLISCGGEDSLDEEEKARLGALMASVDSVAEAAGETWKSKGGKALDDEGQGIPSKVQKMAEKMSSCTEISFNDVDLSNGIPDDTAYLYLDGGEACPVEYDRSISYGSKGIGIRYKYSVNDVDFSDLNDVVQLDIKGSIEYTRRIFKGTFSGPIVSGSQREVFLTVDYRLSGPHGRRSGDIDLNLKFKGPRPFEVDATVAIRRKPSGAVQKTFTLNGSEISIAEFRRLFGWSMGFTHIVPHIKIREN